MSELKAATFDCYGTLVDWHAGIGAFLYDLARRRGEDEPPPGRELRERWEEIQFELISGTYRSYSDVLEDSLRTWVGERGHRWNTLESNALLSAMQAWQPFPEVVPVLRRAREAGLTLGIISNSDHSIMDRTLTQLEVEFDEVVLAEDVRAYKPDAAPFLKMLDTLDVRPEEILHVAFGFRYDIGAAQRLGLRTAWVNRAREERPGDEEPDHEWDSLWGLAELLSG